MEEDRASDGEEGEEVTSLRLCTLYSYAHFAILVDLC